MLTTKDKIELFFELLGIIATFSAVFVALWQTKIQFKKRLKISVSEVMQLIEGNGIFDDATLMIELKISNIGNRDVVITDWGMCLSKKLLFQILNIHEKKLPETLKPEDVLYVRTPITGIQNCIIENRGKIRIYKRTKVKFFVNDSTGKKYYKKSLRSIHGYINLKKDDIFISKEKLNSIK